MNVASYSLFRHEASAYESPRCGASQGVFFANFLPTLVRAHRSCFPDWQLRIHHDKRVTELPYFRVLEAMHARGMMRLVSTGDAETLCGSMLWRTHPAWDIGTERFVCRDIDSLPTMRERKVVDRWAAGEKFCLALHDSQSHSSTTLMGGMVGFDAANLSALSAWLAPTRAEFTQRQKASGIDFNKHGADQIFLSRLGIPADAIQSENRTSIGPQSDPRDICGGHARHVGGAFHALPVRRWYDEHYPDAEVLAVEKEAGFVD